MTRIALLASVLAQLLANRRTSPRRRTAAACTAAARAAAACARQTTGATTAGAAATAGIGEGPATWHGEVSDTHVVAPWQWVPTTNGGNAA